MDTEVLDRPKVPVTARPKTTADILEAAALVIEEFGWVRNAFGDATRGFCILGAIRYANGLDDWDARSLSAHDELRRVTSGFFNPVAHWNDAEGRQSWEVTAALREAAKRARAVTTRSAQDGS